MPDQEEEILSTDEEIAKLEEETMAELQKAGKSNEEKAETKPESDAKESLGKGEEARASDTKEETPSDQDLNPDVAHSKLSERGQNRFQELANTNRELQKKLDYLSRIVERRREIPQVEKASVNPLDPNRYQGSESQEFTPEQLQALIDSRVQETRRKEIILDTLDSDILSVESQYPELYAGTEETPNSDADPKLIDWVTKTYEKLFQVDNTLRFSDFANQVMSLRKQGAEVGRKTAVATMKRQAAEQAVDPSSSPSVAKNDDLENRIRKAKSSQDLDALEALLPHAD